MFDINIQINCVSIERVYCSKFLGVIIDSNCHGKIILITHVTNCQSVLVPYVKPGKNYPNHPWSIYTIPLLTHTWYIVIMYGVIIIRAIWTKMKKSKKKACTYNNLFPVQAYTVPLFLANRLLNVNGINDYVIGIFMYNYLHGDTPNVFTDYFIRNKDIHHHETRGSVDLNVPYGHLDIRKISVKISGARLWNSLLGYVKESNFWCHLINSLKMTWLIEILGIEYVLFLNTMLVFSLLKHACFYFICLYLNRYQ